MGDKTAVFWHEMEKSRALLAAGDCAALGDHLAMLRDTHLTGDPAIDDGRLKMLSLLAKRAEIAFSLRPVAPPRPERAYAPGDEIGPIQAGGRAGVSLVTCSMNRTENLLKALPSWLACDEITEIVVVDWSSDRPVADHLTAAGVDDPRMRVVRVEGEPRWILSYAFNVGFRLAACDTILKVDADIVLSDGFFERNVLADNGFIAGNWRRAAEGQAYINGFFYVRKADLADVGGFNEFITTYGWDDDDIYERLTRRGLSRQDVDPETVFHLPHSDEERVGDGKACAASESALTELRGGTKYLIRRNRFIANVMPTWDGRRPLVSLKVEEWTESSRRLRRASWLPLAVPDRVNADADYYATQELASWRLGPRVLGMAPDRMELLLSKPFARLSRLDVEVVRGNRPEAACTATGYLVVTVRDPALFTAPGAPAAFDRLCERAAGQGLTVVLSAQMTKVPDAACPAMHEVPFVATWENIGQLPELTPDALSARLSRKPAQSYRLYFHKAAIDRLLAMAAPAVATGRRRLFVDVQHGLGNRMRAMASAAVVAAKADRDLVVVWHPDDHCACRLSDLFDYDGAVIEESFPDAAARDGVLVQNYMEIEPGAEKDAPIVLDPGRDLYVRSAYVLNSDLTGWTEENRFLRGLTPVRHVLDLVASVRNPNDLSVHVRMVGAPGTDTASYDRAENWTAEGHAQINKWRELSHYSRFLDRIDALTAEGKADRIFLAADAPETYDVLGERYGERLAYLPRTLYDRSAEQMRYALADVILLGRSPRLLGSTWSSFSELAMRMSPHDMDVEMSGRDF